VRDAQTAGHDVGLSRAMIDAKSTVLRRRFTTLLADGEEAAKAESERASRIGEMLLQARWSYDAIVDGITTLEAGNQENALARRDQLLRHTANEIAGIAELSIGKSFAKASWRQALDALRAHFEQLVAAAAEDVTVLGEIDLAFERFEHIERTTATALRSYRGYLTA
jgi:uncharacterized protein YfiM (DUF2279 family)